MRNGIKRVKVVFKDNQGREVIGRYVAKEDQEAIDEMSYSLFMGPKGIGYDYLPTYFPRWCQASNRQMVGVELDGKLISFQCFTALDNGKTKFSEGLRLHHTFRNQGLNYIQREVNVLLYQPPDAFIRTRTARGQEKLGSLADVKEYVKTRPKTFLLDLRHIFCMSTAPSTLSYFNVNHLDLQESVASASPVEVYKFIEANPSLFPFKGVCLDWVFYDATLELLEAIHRGDPGLIPFEYFLGKQKHQLTSFCATGVLHRPSGTFYEIAFYGKDFYSFRQHLSFLRPRIEKLVKKGEINYLTIWLSDELMQSKENKEFMSQLEEEIFYRRSCFLYETPRLMPAKL